MLYRLIDDPRPGFRLVHADLQHLIEPAELLTHLTVQLAQDGTLGKLVEAVRSIPRELFALFSRSFEELELYQVKVKLREHVRPSWQEYGEELFRRVAASRDIVVFILDEFPMMIDRMARSADHRDQAKTLLRWLRALRQAPQLSNMRFLIAGSIGIDQVLNALGEISAINDLEQLWLEPFPPKVATAFLDELAQSDGLALSQPVKRRILQLIGAPIPYFIQVIYSEILKTQRQDHEGIAPKKIEQIYRDKVLGVNCKTYFDHYYGRLRDYYPPDEEQAVKRILRELATVGELTRDACYQFYRDRLDSRRADVEGFNRLMTDLENDYYVRFDGERQRYEFACKLLRDWWLRHYGMGVDG